MSPDRGFGGWPPTLSTLMGREKKRGVQGAQPPGQGGQGGEAPRKILKKRVLKTHLSMHDLSKIPHSHQFSKRPFPIVNRKNDLKYIFFGKVISVEFENLSPVRRLYPCCINILQKTACLKKSKSPKCKIAKSKIVKIKIVEIVKK
jgi:hypothetical protein